MSRAFRPSTLEEQGRVLLIALSGSGWHGYRGGYYGAGAAYGLMLVFLCFFLLMIAFAGPYWGYYGYWW